MRIVPKMERGDLDKMSIAFRATKQDWDKSGDIPKRTVTEAELVDVSIVSVPAFSGTDIALRSYESAGVTGISPAVIRSRLASKIKFYSG